MEALWYILKENRQNGPYSDHELIRSYQAKNLTDSDLVFKEGLTDWVPFKETALYTEFKREKKQFVREFLDLPPLPPLPELPSHHELPPPPPFIHVPKETPKREVTSHKESYLLLPLFLLVVLISISIWFFRSNSGQSQIEERLALFDQKSRPILMKAFQKNGGPFEVVLDRAGDKIHLASPLDGSAELSLSLFSIDKKTVSPDAIHLTATGTLDNHFAIFDKLTLIKGSAIASGYYQAKIKATFIHRPFWAITAPKVVEKDQVIFLSTLSPDEFERRLTEFHKELKEKGLLPYQTLLEKYRTLKAVVNKSETDLPPIIKSIKVGKDSKRYEYIYLNQINPLLQNILEDQKSIDLSIDSESPLFLATENFNKLATTLMGTHAKMIESIQKIKRTTPKDNQRLESEFNEAHQLISSEINQEILRIENFLKEE